MRAPTAGNPLGAAGRVTLVCVLVVGVVLAAADPLMLMFFLSYALVGAYLIVQRPRNVIGWLMVAIGFGYITTTAPPDLDTAALFRGDASFRDTFTTWINGWGGWASYVALIALTAVVPGGRLPEGRARGVAIVQLAVGTAIVGLLAFAPTVGVIPDGMTTIQVPNPMSLLPDLSLWSALNVANIGGPIIFLALAIGVVQMVRRYRASSGIERQQLRWLVAAVAFVFAAVMIGLGSLAVLGDAIGGAGWIPALVAVPTIPLAVGVAVMRYRLFEIDRIISRTIGWGLVTGCLVIVFAGGVIALQAALDSFTQGATLAVAASTLVAFALFQPVRRRVQRSVDRRFDRARYDGEQTAVAFAERLRDEVDLATLETDIAGTIKATLRPTMTGIWLRPASRNVADLPAP